MAVFETFSKRQARLRGDVPDVYTYDTLPRPLRVQLFQAIEEGIGGWYRNGNANPISQQIYETIVKVLRREYGVFGLREGLLNKSGGTYLEELKDHILEAKTERVLDAVELCMTFMANDIKQENRRTSSTLRMQAALHEINVRFRESGVGYEFVGDQIVRIDSELVHAEAVKPAIALLSNKLFAGAEQEFLSAFDHYKAGKTKEALTDALKSIESTLKVIFTKRQWAFNPTDPVKKLLDVAFANDLIPPYWTSHFTSLRSMLESSVPTARNKTSGHGQGVTIQQVPDHLASYVLHMTASTIVFLVKAEQALP